jgi:hypothetical protein
MKDTEIDNIRFGDWPMPEEYLVELGRINAIWASLENVINITLVKISGFDIHDPRGIIMFEHLSMPQKLDILGSLGDQLLAEHPHLKDLPESISKIKTAQSSRNKFIHNALNYDPETKTLELPIATARGKLIAKVNKISKADLKRVIVEISIAQRHLHKTVFKKEYPHPWE